MHTLSDTTTSNFHNLAEVLLQAGKTTLVRLVAEHFRQHERFVVITLGTTPQILEHGLRVRTR